MKTAQTRLGHSDPRWTLGLYARASSDADREAADRVGERYFVGKVSTRTRRPEDAIPWLA
jgi:hypothetical protein